MSDVPATVTLRAGRNFLREYNELKAQGYTTVWAGNGQCCLQAPAPGTPLPEPAEIIVCIPPTACILPTACIPPTEQEA